MFNRQMALAMITDGLTFSRQKIPDDISKADTVRITKLGVEMFHHEFWKLISFGVKRSKIEVTTSVSVRSITAAYVSYPRYSRR